MSMDLGGAKGGVKSDINVTPLVDVMLVLLIIMMLVAPMLQKGVDVRLPRPPTRRTSRRRRNRRWSPSRADKRYLRQRHPGVRADLLQRVQSALEDKKEKIVLIKADKDAPYATIMDADGRAAPGRRSRTSASSPSAR